MPRFWFSNSGISEKNILYKKLQACTLIYRYLFCETNGQKHCAKKNDKVSLNSDTIFPFPLWFSVFLVLQNK